jgi:hypothetical protein
MTSALTEILRAVAGLFVDDELLAIGVLGTVGLTALLISAFGATPLAAGAVLLIGNVLVLVAGVVRTARRKGHA